MRRTAGDSEAALVLRHTGLDFSTWRWTQHLDPTLLDLDCWLSRDRPWTKAEIPALERYGYVAFYPMRQMPCCGIAIDTRGSLHTIGSLPTEDGQWLWDDGTIRAAFEALTLPKPKPLQSRLEKLLASAQSFFGEVVSVMRGDVASGVLHASDGNRPPYRFDLGDGEYVSVEINDQDRTVTITPNLGDPRPYFLFWVDANGEGSVAANEAMSAWAEIKTRDDEFECPKDIPLDSLEPIIVVRPVSVD